MERQEQMTQLYRLKEEKKITVSLEPVVTILGDNWEYSVHVTKHSSSVCLRLCDPMNQSTPGLPVHHQLPEFTQTHVHRVSDAIQPSHPLSVVPFSSCPQSFPASGSFQMSQLFALSGQSTGVSALASHLPKSTQGWSPLFFLFF